MLIAFSFRSLTGALFSASLLSMLFFTSTCFADDRFKVEQVLLVDMQKVLADSIVGKAAKSDLQSELRKAQGALQVKKIELDKLKSDFEKKRAVLSGSSLEQKREEIVKKERALAREFEDSKEEVTRKTSQQMDKIILQAQDAIKEVASDKGHVLVLEKSSRLVVSAKEGLDITAEIIKVMDEKRLGS